MSKPKFKVGDFVIYNHDDPVWARYNGSVGIVIGIKKSTRFVPREYKYTVRWISVVVNKRIKQLYAVWGRDDDWERGWDGSILEKWSGK